MKTFLAITPAQMRSINQTAVLEYIRMHRQASRAIIAKDLDISLPSVVRITDSLLEQNLLRFSGQMEDSGGRKRPLLELEWDHNVSIGVLLQHSGISICTVTLAGKIREERSVPLYIGELERTLEGLMGILDTMIEKIPHGHFLRGISISVPGIVEHGSGTIVTAPSIDWKNVPLKEILASRFRYPVVVENDVNLAILGEMWYGFGQKCFDLALMEIGTGLGAGFIMGGAVYRGANDAAGELGHMVFEAKDLRPEHSLFGPVEEDVAGIGLARKTKAALGSVLRGDEPEQELIRLLFSAYRAQEAWAREIVRVFLERMAMVINAAYAVANPEIIVLRGYVMEEARFLLDDLRALIYRRICIQVSELIPHAEILGGAVSIQHHTLDYCNIRSMY